MRNHHARNRNHHSRLSISFQSVGASRLQLGLEPRFRSLASGATASTCSGKSSDYQNKCLKQITRMWMLRYPVFLDAGNLIQGQAASKSLAFQTPDKHETNSIGTSNIRNRTNRSRSKAVQNAPFLCDLLLLAGPTVNVIPR